MKLPILLAVLLVAPVGALAASGPDAAVLRVQLEPIGMVEGTVEELEGSRVTVRDAAGAVHTLSLAPGVLVVEGPREVSVGALREGQRVRAFYASGVEPRVATRIDILRPLRRFAPFG